MDFEVAVLWGNTVRFVTHDDFIYIIKDNRKRPISHELFNDMYYVLNDSFLAALKIDCIMFKDVEDGVLLKNYLGDEMVIPLPTFLENYIV